MYLDVNSGERVVQRILKPGELSAYGEELCDRSATALEQGLGTIGLSLTVLAEGAEDSARKEAARRSADYAKEVNSYRDGMNELLTGEVDPGSRLQPEVLANEAYDLLGLGDRTLVEVRAYTLDGLRLFREGVNRRLGPEGRDYAEF